jgi:hypothetical protein
MGNFPDHARIVRKRRTTNSRPARFAATEKKCPAVWVRGKELNGQSIHRTPLENMETRKITVALIR